MNEEYLWDKSGPPDIEVAHIEKLLGGLRYQPKPKKSRLPWMLAAAAMAAAVLVFVMWPKPVTAWEISGKKLHAGQWVETSETEQKKIEAQFTGEVILDHGSRLRIVASREDQQRFQLQRGTIHALIWAPPGRFVVDSPSARTVDLGCRYTLQVSETGEGLLTVETGWVAFEKDRKESFIPAGAVCITRPEKGPGTPWFADAPEPMKRAVEKFDESDDERALRSAVAEARDRDALTLWHLLARTSGEQRGLVFARFAKAVKLPGVVTREAILAGNAAAIDGAWNALDLGSTGWWRDWKRKW